MHFLSMSLTNIPKVLKGGPSKIGQGSIVVL